MKHNQQWFAHLYGIMFIADRPEDVIEMVESYERTASHRVQSIVVRPCVGHEIAGG